MIDSGPTTGLMIIPLADICSILSSLEKVCKEGGRGREKYDVVIYVQVKNTISQSIAEHDVLLPRTQALD